MSAFFPQILSRHKPEKYDIFYTLTARIQKLIYSHFLGSFRLIPVDPWRNRRLPRRRAWARPTSDSLGAVGNRAAIWATRRRSRRRTRSPWRTSAASATGRTLSAAVSRSAARNAATVSCTRRGPSVWLSLMLASGIGTRFLESDDQNLLNPLFLFHVKQSCLGVTSNQSINQSTEGFCWIVLLLLVYWSSFHNIVEYQSKKCIFLIDCVFVQEKSSKKRRGLFAARRSD